jgi:hypothetical protein
MSTSAIRSFPALQSAADVPNKPLPAPAGEWGIRGYGIERPIREIPAGALDGGYVSIPVSTDASTLLSANGNMADLWTALSFFDLQATSRHKLACTDASWVRVALVSSPKRAVN